MCVSRLTILLLSSALAYGAPIVVPPGLNPGDPYRLVFVSSAVTQALSPDIGYYNALATRVANTVPELAALNASWFAIASTGSVAARTNIGQSDSPIYRVDGVRVAQGTADLWDGRIENPVRAMESGALFSGMGYVWTGTDWTGWTSYYLGSSGATRGDLYHTDSYWMNKGPEGTENAHPIYAISSELVVPGAGPSQVPEPSSLALIPVGLGLIALARYSRR